MGFAEVISSWRARLAQLVTRTPREWYAGIERRVLSYLLWRHADAPYAEPPNQAERLGPADAKRSSKLLLDDETRARLGLSRSRDVLVIEDLQREERERALLVFRPSAEAVVAIEIHPHPRWHCSLVETVARSVDPGDISRLTDALRSCRPVSRRYFSVYWHAMVRLVKKSGFVEFEVIRTEHDGNGTFVSFYTHCADAPRFRNDSLSPLLEDIAAKYEVPEPSTDEATEVLPAPPYPEL